MLKKNIVKIMASAMITSGNLPDIFSSYADTAYSVHEQESACSQIMIT